MSGHRRVKNIDYDDGDYDDYDYDEEATGTTEQTGNDNDLTEDDREQLRQGTVNVRQRLGDSSHIEDKAIQDALWHYWFDVDKTVVYLKNENKPLVPQQTQVKQTSRFDQAAASSAAKAGVATTNGTKSNQPKQQKKESKGTGQITKAVDDLSIKSAPPTPVKLKSKNLDVAKEYQKTQKNKELNFVVVGHIDHGKSTLMGRLLLEHKVVDQRSLERFRKEAAKLGKESFALAWVMDAREDEREHGVTIDYAEKSFSTTKTDFIIIDAPGHRDFVGNMIAGTSLADFALLVVDAGTNNFSAGLKGQTKEHAQIVRALKLGRLVVAVNKMDSVSWSADAYANIKQQATAFLAEQLFDPADITFVPCAGLTGDNIIAKPTSSKSQWYTGPTLIEALDALEPQREQYLGSISDPFRLRTAAFSGLSEHADLTPHEVFTVFGRVDAGHIQVGDAIVSQPAGETGFVKGITKHGEPVDWAVPGQIVGLQLVDFDEERVNKGELICRTDRPAKNASLYQVKILAFDTVFPMPVDVYRGRMRGSGMITELVARLDGKTHEVLRAKPKRIVKGETARVLLEMDEETALERPTRIILRYGQDTVAAGAVERAIS